MKRQLLTGGIWLMVLLVSGCVKNGVTHDLEGLIENETERVSPGTYKVVQGMKLGKEVTEAQADVQLKHSLAVEASLLCRGKENIKSMTHEFSDYIYMSHGLTERAFRNSQVKAGFYRRVTGHISCHEESVQSVSTAWHDDKSYQTVKSIKVLAHVIYPEDYRQKLEVAVMDEAQQQCADGVVDVVLEFNTYSTTTFHIQVAETHVLVVSGDVFCR